ncbi:hypothetical protein JT359_06650 [Candidatus Poribacteria bacterium]|nr:hypothetical protein [Candidatus Poribacteria bacterium]
MEYKELATKKPFIVNKNLGSAVEVEPEELTSANADELPIIYPTQKQKYDFDRQGWVVIPNVLSDEEIIEIRTFCDEIKYNKQDDSKWQHCGLEGPLQKLTDHPVIVGFLNEFLSYPPAASEECYGFRLEKSDVIFGSIKNGGENNQQNSSGNGLFRLPGDSHIYRCVPGRAWSGLTRVIWELTDVNAETNDIRYITSSHKSAYALPQSIHHNNSQIWDTYSCPAGSLIIMTESITKKYISSTIENVERLRITNLYNTVASRWCNWRPSSELLESMPPKRQTLFRDTYAGGNVINGDFGDRTSAYPINI